MPFGSTGTYSFSVQAIEAYVPSSHGIYALRNRERWICVGQAANLRQNLINHCLNPSACIARWRPESFAFEVVEPRLLFGRQSRLIMELQPVCPATQ
jgi:hypothetical protein